MTERTGRVGGSHAHRLSPGPVGPLGPDVFALEVSTMGHSLALPFTLEDLEQLVELTRLQADTLAEEGRPAASERQARISARLEQAVAYAQRTGRGELHLV